MIDTHEREKRQFKRLFQQQGIDRFDLRFKVLEAFLKLEHHVTIQDILEQAKKDGLTLEREFVSSSMTLLCRFGFATQNDFYDQEPYYEHRHLGVHHDHMVCTKCGKILEFRDEAVEAMQLKVAEAYGFHMLQHKMEIYGLCADCMASRNKLVPLHKAKQGEQVVIAQVEAGKSIHMRISSMGLRIGDKIEVVSSGFGGQVVLACGENRLVLGKGMAEKIKVRPLVLSSDQPGMAPEKSGRDTGGPVMTLSRMKAGQKGIIRKVSGEGLLRRRLLEMGINRGSEIYVEKYAPLKDPIELVVKGYHISLRVEEAANILVENVTG